MIPRLLPEHKIEIGLHELYKLRTFFNCDTSFRAEVMATYNRHADHVNEYRPNSENWKKREREIKELRKSPSYDITHQVMGFKIGDHCFGRGVYKCTVYNTASEGSESEKREYNFLTYMHGFSKDQSRIYTTFAEFIINNTDVLNDIVEKAFQLDLERRKNEIFNATGVNIYIYGRELEDQLRCPDVKLGYNDRYIIVESTAGRGIGQYPIARGLLVTEEFAKHRTEEYYDNDDRRVYWQPKNESFYYFYQVYIEPHRLSGMFVDNGEKVLQ